MSTTILFIGLMVFFAHFLSLQFRKTNIPDVLVLVIVGIVLGPVLGFVSPADFGKVGSLFATIALVVILFEGGTTLDMNVLGKSLSSTGKLALGCFLLTTLIVAAVGMYALGLTVLPAAMLGLTLGSTSPAVIIPLVKALRVSEKPATVLVLESALTDVLSIVGVFALLQVQNQGAVGAGHRLAAGIRTRARLPQHHFLDAGVRIHRVRRDRRTGLFRRHRVPCTGHHADQFREIQTEPHPEHRPQHRAAERS
jgi:cell volume regulation protein A